MHYMTLNKLRAHVAEYSIVTECNDFSMDFGSHPMKPDSTNRLRPLPQRLTIGYYDSGGKRMSVYAYMFESVWEVRFATCHSREPDWKSIDLRFGLESLFQEKGRFDPFIEEGIKTYVRFRYLQHGLKRSFPLLTDQTLSIFENVCRSIANKSPLDPAAIKSQPDPPTTKRNIKSTSTTSPTETSSPQTNLKRTNSVLKNEVVDEKAHHDRKDVHISLMREILTKRENDRRHPDDIRKIQQLNDDKEKLSEELKSAHLAMQNERAAYEARFKWIEANAAKTKVAMEAKAQKDSDQFNADLNSKDRKVCALETEHKIKDNRISTLQNQLSREGQDHAATKKQLSETTNKLTEALNKLSETEKQLKEAVTKLSETEKKVTETDKKLAVVEKNLVGFQEDMEKRMAKAKSLYQYYKELLEADLKESAQSVKDRVFKSLEDEFGLLNGDK